jgi:8-oxo-dGTP pyrophosphatase MutT (NUDIX family)
VIAAENLHVSKKNCPQKKSRTHQFKFLCSVKAASVCLWRLFLLHQSLRLNLVSVNKLRAANSYLSQFDPRQVPVVGVDSHLPSINLVELSPEALIKRFIHPPLWTPELREEKNFSTREPAHAAVLIPIVVRDQPMVLMTERSLHLSAHSGQIAFPGGKVDEGDSDRAATALREAHEEVGLHASFVHVLGVLPDYVTGSSFIVTPVIALVNAGFTLTVNSDEVADTFEVPLQFLMNPANHRRHKFKWNSDEREWFSMPYQDQDKSRYIWGATAGMIRNLYRLLSA